MIIMSSYRPRATYWQEYSAIMYRYTRKSYELGDYKSAVEFQLFAAEAFIWSATEMYLMERKS